MLLPTFSYNIPTQIRMYQHIPKACPGFVGVGETWHSIGNDHPESDEEDIMTDSEHRRKCAIVQAAN